MNCSRLWCDHDLSPCVAYNCSSFLTRRCVCVCVCRCVHARARDGRLSQGSVAAAAPRGGGHGRHVCGVTTTVNARRAELHSTNNINNCTHSPRPFVDRPRPFGRDRCARWPLAQPHVGNAPVADVDVPIAARDAHRLRPLPPPAAGIGGGELCRKVPVDVVSRLVRTGRRYGRQRVRIACAPCTERRTHTACHTAWRARTVGSTARACTRPERCHTARTSTSAHRSCSVHSMPCGGGSAVTWLGLG